MSVEIGRRRWLAVLPLAGAGALGIGFWRMLGHMGRGSFDPRAIDTPIVGRPLPAFALPGLGDNPGFDSGALARATGPVLLNFFASWCLPCIAEAQALAALSIHIPIWGIAYKDRPEDTQAFLARDGDPFARLARDQEGTTAIDWGVTGVPESFLVLPGGHIAWHTSGGLTAESWARDVAPAIRRAGHAS